MIDEILNIDILLSTYNGGKYLQEQIQSVFNQTNKNWRILVRDDGSSDDTIEILTFYSRNYPDKFSWVDKKSVNLGVVKSFELLLQNSESPYIMFADQDDVWLPNKIEDSLELMNKMELKYPDKALLVHSDLKVVDEYLNELYPSFWKLSQINPSLLTNFYFLGVYNGISGCTIMINKTAKKLSLPFQKDIRMHDYWIGLCVAKWGRIDYLRTQTIMYRQHTDNTIGIKGIHKNYLATKLRDIINVIKNNNAQFKILKKLDYGCFCKYLMFKLLYFIKARLC